MSKSWRPEGWQNPFPVEAENNPDSAYAIGRRGFEVGADAMLETLRKQGDVVRGSEAKCKIRDMTSYSILIEVPKGYFGTYVFIPDDLDE